jgi:transcriptional regulator with XRE-family HTH domain
VSKIRTVRKARTPRLSQEKVAWGAGLTLSTYRRIESGQNSPRVDELQAIAKALGVPAAELLDEPEEASA